MTYREMHTVRKLCLKHSHRVVFGVEKDRNGDYSIAIFDQRSSSRRIETSNALQAKNYLQFILSHE